MNRPSEELLHKTLENRATAAEAASVAEWLATDSGQAWASRYIGRDFDRQESCGDYEREEVASERIFARIKTALTRGRRRRILFRVAAVVIPVALVLGVALRLDRQVGGIFSDAEYGEFVVDRGRRTQCLFQDGTVAHLNSESKIHYPVKFGLFERRIRLEGEAYFEVEHDRHAPFVVSTNGLNVRVLGTRFNIRNDDNEHRVTTVLLEGAVKAYASGREQASVRLHPAQQLVFDTRTHAMRLTDCPSAERSINWIDGRFCFEHDTFGEIVAELKRYYNVDIRFMDNRLRDMRFSGNFRVEDGIYHIMSVLQLTYKFNYRIAGNDIELYANPER